jgi:hypothetical protein
MIDHHVTGHHDDTEDNDYDRVTARDIADLPHHHAQMRCGPLGDHPAARAEFLHRKADLLTRIADQAARTRVDDYVEQVRQMATEARAAADHPYPQLPRQRVGPNQRRTPDHSPDPGGANSEENTGASFG